MMEEIKFDHVSFSYQKKEIISDLSLEIKEGEFIGLKGENGSGKTTFLNILLKLLKPTSGKVINSFKKKAFLSQLTTTDDSFFPSTIEEIVSLGLKCSPFSFMKKADYKIVDDYLESFDLLKYKGKQINELSGGEQQKVRLLKALISKPSLLVLDEPSSGIDKKSQDEINHLIDKIHRENKITIIIVSHLNEDFLYTSKIYTLEGGKIR